MKKAVKVLFERLEEMTLEKHELNHELTLALSDVEFYRDALLKANEHRDKVLKTNSELTKQINEFTSKLAAAEIKIERAGDVPPKFYFNEEAAQAVEKIVVTLRDNERTGHDFISNSKLLDFLKASRTLIGGSLKESKAFADKMFAKFYEPVEMSMEDIKRKQAEARGGYPDIDEQRLETYDTYDK